MADTSVFIARESGRRLDESLLPEELAVSVITVGELRAGVLAADDVDTRERRLDTLQDCLSMDPMPVDDSVARTWARLRLALRDGGLVMGVNDSWIAATAMALDVPVVTQDREYAPAPGLAVVTV